LDADLCIRHPVWFLRGNGLGRVASDELFHSRNCPYLMESVLIKQLIIQPSEVQEAMLRLHHFPVVTTG
jgi:hypothetical protein